MLRVWIPLLHGWHGRPFALLQVGPAVGLNGADDLVISRFLLQRVAEDLQVVVSLDPKVSLDTS